MASSCSLRFAEKQRVGAGRPLRRDVSISSMGARERRLPPVPGHSQSTTDGRSLFKGDPLVRFLDGWRG
jgi:hypothetical protein